MEMSASSPSSSYGRKEQRDSGWKGLGGARHGDGASANFQPAHQSDSLESLFQSFLSLPLSEDRLQPADELRSKPLRLYMDVLWHAVRALRTRACTNASQWLKGIRYFSRARWLLR